MYAPSKVREVVELLVVVDASGSVSADEWTSALAFTKTLPQALSSGNPAMELRVGVIQFASSAKCDIALTSYASEGASAADFAKRVDAIRRDSGGTVFHLAITCCEQAFRASPRPDGRCIVVFQTDGADDAGDNGAKKLSDAMASLKATARGCL
jgi:Mg-chelatase subunit ChlD